MMGATVKHYEGRGQLMDGRDFVAHVLYSVQAWRSDLGSEVIIGSISASSPIPLPEDRITPYVLHLETGATLACTVSPLPTPESYELTVYGTINAPRPR
jgi:hypothetical protein